MQSLEKILIANRGEIALRIIRAARAMHLQTVAVYSTDEARALHVRLADESVSLGAGSLNETYLNIEKMIQTAQRMGAQAIHPGYGFLSEDARFAAACSGAGITFIGPHADVLQLMGNKMEAKRFAQKLGIPVLLGQTLVAGQLNGEAKKLHYPLLIKASHGGGGKGMQIVNSAGELDEKLTQASRSAASYFGNGEVYIEPYVAQARHIEVQILGDHHGNLVHLYERDCTLQRNHQKIVEEAPAANLPSEVQEKLLEAALLLGKETHYSGAGTVEFLVEPDGRFWFMEMNPRIQVEHPVTEEVTGIDIVREQLRIAAGEPLSFRQTDIRVNGHAVEVRIYREDPEKAFAPSTAPVHYFRLPGKEGIRLETDLDGRNAAGSQFDPLIAKVITHGENRGAALADMQYALGELTVHGPKTNLSYLKHLLKEPSFRNNNIHTAYCGEELNRHLDEMSRNRADVPREVLQAAYLYLGFLRKQNQPADTWEQVGYWRLQNEVTITIDGQAFPVVFSSRKEEITLVGGDSLHVLTVTETEPQQLDILFNRRHYQVTWSTHPVAGKWLETEGFHFHLTSPDLLDDYHGEAAGENEADEGDGAVVRSPLHGKIIDIQVKHKQIIEKGEVLLVIESMKSENHIISSRAAKIKSIVVEVGSQVTDEMPLIILEDI